MNLRPDPTFYPTAQMAMEAPAETLAFTLMLSPDGSQPDGLAIVDVDPTSKTYSQIVHQVIMPNKGDEFHHFGWNACSSSLSPLTGHAFLERRYLIIPGIRSSRIYVIDVKEPLEAKIHKIIEPEEVFAKTGYSRPHTIHCGPEGIYVSTLGGGGEDGTDGPPGIGCPVIASIGHANAVLIVTEPTVSGIHDMERVGQLAAHFKMPAMICINKYDLNPDQAQAIEAIAKEKDMVFVGKLPFDPAFTKAMVQGKSIMETHADSPAAAQIKQIWNRIMEHPAMKMDRLC